MSYNKETGLYEGYIYKITNIVNNKIYIGQTITTINNRWRKHCEDAMRCPMYAFDNAINKYGKENFIIEEIKKVCKDTRDDVINELNKLEIYFINKYNSLVNHNGYNISSGGNNKNYRMIKVDVYDLNGEYINTYNSITEASLFCGVTPSNISKCCKGKSFVAKEYVFRYYGDPFNLYPTTNYMLEAQKLYMEKPISQYSLEGDFINTYSSINNACEVNGFKKYQLILNCCNLISRSAYGYQWKFEDDDREILPYVNNIHKLKHPVNQYNLNGEYIKSFYTTTELCKIIGTTNIYGVYRCANHNKYCKTYKGFSWFYIDDEMQPDKTQIKEVEI